MGNDDSCQQLTRQIAVTIVKMGVALVTQGPKAPGAPDRLPLILESNEPSRGKPVEVLARTDGRHVEMAADMRGGEGALCLQYFQNTCRTKICHDPQNIAPHLF